MTVLAPLLHVGHATGTFEGILTLVGLGLSSVGLGVAVLAVQRAIIRRASREKGR